MTNSTDLDQLASSESGSTLFAKTGHVVLSKRRVNYLPGLDVQHVVCGLPIIDWLLTDSLSGIPSSLRKLL